MATTFVDYTGDGNATKAFSFPSIKEADIKVDVDGVIKTSGSHYNITSYTTTGGGNVVFTSGNIPASPAAIRIFRDTDVDSAKATFTAGSSIKAGDLNNNMTQILYAAQEEQNQTILSSDIKDGAIKTADIADNSVTTAKIADANVTTAKIADGSVNSSKLGANAVTTGELADTAVNTVKLDNLAVTTAKIADGNVVTVKIADGNITTAKIAGGAVTTAKLGADCVTQDKIADDAVREEHLADQAVTTARIADAAVNNSKLGADCVTQDKIADDAVRTEHFADNSVTTSVINNGAINESKLASNAVTTSKIASDAVTTVKITDANVTTAKIADSNVTTAKIAADAVTGAKIADDAINSEHYTDGSIDTAHIADSAVTSPKIANNAIQTAKIADGMVSTAKIGGAQVTDAKLASNAVTTSKITDANVTTVKIADSNVTLAKLASDLKQTTISDSDTQLPTSGAVVDYVAAQLLPFGGFEAIATELAFPNTQPASGVAISISDAGGVVFNGSGSSTTGRTVGGTTVTINNAPSSLNSETLAAGVGLIVTSTGSGQIYNYHKILGKESDIKQLSDDINDFQARYRVGTTNPTSALDAGDLFFNTTSSKLLVYNGTNSAWEEAQSIGQFFINTISSYSGTGGNSATFNGSAYRFVLSNPGANAEQHLVSINGVIQKPNSGTSQPSEGFAIDGSSIIFSSAPASNADFFIVTIGASVNIGTPSANTVATLQLTSGAVTTAKIADDAVITSKIADNAVTSAKIVSGGVQAGNINSNAVSTGTIQASAVTTAKIADQAVTLAKLEHGTSSNNGKFLRANNGADPTFETVNTDLVSDTSPQLGGSLNSNGNNILFADSNASTNLVKFGDGDDLKIYHNGTSNIINNTTKELHINSSTETLAKFVPNGAVKLYHNNVRTFQTSSHGAQFYAPEGGTCQVYLYADEGDDNADLWGLQASHSSSQFKLINYASGSYEDSIVANGDGNVELYYDNSKKFETTSAGVLVSGSLTADGGNAITLGDNKKIVLGTGSDFEILHTGSGSYLKDVGTGNLELWSSTVVFRNAAGNEVMAAFLENGTSKLYYDNVQRFETTSTGAKISGTGVTFLEINTTDGGVNPMVRMTNGDHTFDTGLRGDTSDAWCIYDVTNTDVRFMITTGGDVQIPNDNKALKIGAGQDLQIYHDGSSSYINNINNHTLIFMTNNGERWGIEGGGHFKPHANDSYDIGTSSYRVRNIYTNDLHLSNEGKTNDIDGTWGNWTIQEGESDLFLKNNRSGKKYKFSLTEVS